MDGAADAPIEERGLHSWPVEIAVASVDAPPERLREALEWISGSLDGSRAWTAGGPDALDAALRAQSSHAFFGFGRAGASLEAPAARAGWTSPGAYAGSAARAQARCRERSAPASAAPTKRFAL